MGKLTQEMLEDSLIDSNELMQVSNCDIIIVYIFCASVRCPILTYYIFVQILQKPKLSQE